MAWRPATPHHLKNLWRVGETECQTECKAKTIYSVQAIPVKPANPENESKNLTLTTPGNPWATLEYIVVVSAGTFEAKLGEDGRPMVGRNIRRIS